MNADNLAGLAARGNKHRRKDSARMPFDLNLPPCYRITVGFSSIDWGSDDAEARGQEG
jgi:hypothetical protein